MASMRTTLSLLAGILIGCAATIGYVAASGGWYEYHILDSGEDPLVLVNQQGWELVTYERPIWQFRRPRFRLH